MEQIQSYMAQQNALNNNRPPNPSQQTNPPDILSENVAFLASLDPATRAQVLIEATP
jgi:hypothetical protein